MYEKVESIVEEARRLEENCLYTSTTLYIWLHVVRGYNAATIILPIIFAGIASLAIFSDEYKWLTAVSAMFAGIIPAMGVALKIETRIDEIARLASEYKAMQTRFRQLADSAHQNDIYKAQVDLDALTGRYESVVKGSLTPPEWAFKKAQAKIKGGDYTFDTGACQPINVKAS